MINILQYMETKKIYIIRHWESDCCWLNHDDFIPDLEGGLTTTGIDQVKSLATCFALKWIIFDALYSSSKQRTLETSQILQDEYFVKSWNPLSKKGLFVSEEIVSRNYWLWAKQPKKNFVTDENRDTYYNDHNFHPPWGESSNEVYLRSIRFLKSLVNQDWSSLWVVTHSRVVEAVHRYYSYLLDPRIHPFDFPKFPLNNAAVLLVTLVNDGKIASIDTLNQDT